MFKGCSFIDEHKIMNVKTCHIKKDTAKLRVWRAENPQPIVITHANFTWLLKECALVIIPTITNIFNLSLRSGHFHPLGFYPGSAFTPLSTLISSLSLYHHLYADDTQLFSPFIS